MGYKIIETVDELKKALIIKNGMYTDFYIVLAGGLARSSKRVRYDKKNNLFDVHNEIDDSFQENLSEEELGTKTMIKEAIEKFAFFQIL